MKNRDVARAFANRHPARAGNFHTDGETIWSYETVLARWHPTLKVVFLNTRKYTVSTTRHQSLIRSELYFAPGVRANVKEYESADSWRLWRSWRDDPRITKARP